MQYDVNNGLLQVVIEGEELNAVVGEAAQIDVGEAINYIQTGTTEIEQAVQEGITQFNGNATEKTNEFNLNAQNKTSDFNANATQKTLDFNANAVEKTNDFNSNAQDKTGDFNNNATDKTGDFNDNASDKTSDFNLNAQNKTSDFNDNYTEKKGLIDTQVVIAEGAATTATNQAGLAKQWAIGDPSEPIGNSSKYWAEYAESIAQSIGDPANKDLSNLSTTGNNRFVNLQQQIDAIVASSDVFDIVGTYAELQAYDITTVPVNDIIKVLVDSTHSGAATYYRCVESGGVKSWSYIGSEGAYYTKGEADGKFSTITATGSSLNYTGNTLSLENAQGTVLSSVTIQSSPDLDNKSITKNSSNELQTVGVINSRDSSTAVKTWTGTKAQYDGILSKDANTLYNTDNGLFLGTTQVASLSSVRNIGEIIQSTIPLTDAGLHLLDGSLISGSGSYADFVTYIASLVSSYPDCFCSEADWQTSVTNYGACDKFVYDSVNNTVRLPKRSTTHGKLIKSYSSGTGWYRIYSDGWCEQGDSKVPSQSSWKTITLSIPFTSTNYQVLVSCNGNTNGTSTWTSNVDGQTYSNSQIQIKGTNAGEQWLMSWSACGYVDITDLQQNTVYEYIVIATSVKTEIEVDIDEIATDLNGKADVDLSNCTAVHIVETWHSGTEWYRVYSDGWCEQGGELDVSSGSSVVLQKPFINTSYSILTGSYDKHSPNDKNYAVVQWRDKQTTGFTLQAALNGNFYTTTVDWRACGYIS